MGDRYPAVRHTRPLYDPDRNAILAVIAVRWLDCPKPIMSALDSRSRCPPRPRGATATACRARSISPTRCTPRDRADLDGGWIFAGFAFEIPNPGDFLTLAVDASPVLVIRGDDGRVRAFHNVCRHRGSQLCRTDAGHVRALVCPYHSWTYSRQGELVACHGMHDGIDKSQLGLRPLHAQVCAGFVYVSLAEAPPAFEGLRARSKQPARPQGFDRARIAKSIDYEVEANWKLVWENNRECFHCTPLPSAIREVELRRLRGGVMPPRQSAGRWRRPSRARRRSGRRRARRRAPGGGLATFPDPDNDLWYAATARRSPRASPPNRWTASASRR